MPKKRYKHTIYWYAKVAAKRNKEDLKEFLRMIPRLESVKYLEHNDITRPPRPWSDRDTSIIFAELLFIDVVLLFCWAAIKFYDPRSFERIKHTVAKNVRKIQRSSYYKAETARRHQLARSRRKISRRTTLAEMPTPEAIKEAWDKRKDSKENMIILGGMLHDLECYVDNRLKFDEHGDAIGRNSGIKGWLKMNLPELAPKYKTLMRYKAMAIKLRQATNTLDPKPTSALLDTPHHQVVNEVLNNLRNTFTSIMEVLEYYLSVDTVLEKKKDVFTIAKDDR